jgi:predicted nucleic acid-binding protein
VTYYLDSSAAVKLVKPEAETPALVAFIKSTVDTPSGGSLVAGDILRTELIAAVMRAGLARSAAIDVLDGVYLLRLTGSICETAGSLAGELGLRSLDALHLAVAVSARSSIRGVITYDQRFATAASELGFVVEAPA